MAEKKLPAVARRVHTDCKKCETGRYHVIVAHKTSTSAKVQCEVCGRSSTYSVAKSTIRRKAAASKKSHFDQLETEFGSQQQVPYKISSSYEINQKIEHKSFGTGYVVKVLPTKIEVVFTEETKLLIHNH